jgi:hypothetical protein
MAHNSFISTTAEICINFESIIPQEQPEVSVLAWNDVQRSSKFA